MRETYPHGFIWSPGLRGSRTGWVADPCSPQILQPARGARGVCAVGGRGTRVGGWQPIGCHRDYASQQPVCAFSMQLVMVEETADLQLGWCLGSRHQEWCSARCRHPAAIRTHERAQPPTYRHNALVLQSHARCMHHACTVQQGVSGGSARTSMHASGRLHPLKHPHPHWPTH